jgi:hypothetical protein
MRRVTTDPAFLCVSCEFEIVGRPEFHVGLPFCCAGCVAGGPCTCSYDPDELELVVEVIPAERPVAVPA